MFQHDHAVGPLRQHAPRGYPDRFSGFKRPVRNLAHPDFAAYFQQGGKALSGAIGIFAFDGKTIHRGSVETRQIFGGKDWDSSFVRH